MRKFFLALAAIALPQVALALPVPHKDVEFQLNRGVGSMQRTQLGTRLMRESKRVMRARYDFAVGSGSSLASITLKDVNGGNAVLPDGAIITNVIFDVLTAPTSNGSAQLAFTAASAGDLKAATAIASFTGLVAGVPVGTAATAIKLTAEATLAMAVTVADLTAGKIDLLIEYHLVE
jgi:hypothetical protein